ncbi:hypothetical protein BD779DRAFT_1548999 [Infundibulicybe gibba]|nr:hypothetical protein BD779DRAFT_1548999 [Infundibulicybe gibba]
MGEVMNVVVAFAVIVFLFRWATKSSSDPGERNAADTLGFRPKPVTQEMLTLYSDNVRYDLLRTGSVELTSNKILERGFLDAPPASYYTIYPREPPTLNRPDAPNNASNTRNAIPKTNESLITRYHLESRIADAAATTTSDAASPEDAGGRAVWEDSPEKREASLRERKAQMILAARQRLLAQQAQAAGKQKQKAS